MPKPNTVTDEQVAQWSKTLDDDLSTPLNYKLNPVIREVMIVGYWLAEELLKLSCPQEKILRIQYTVGAASFGRDAWDTAQNYIDKYKSGNLTF